MSSYSGRGSWIMPTPATTAGFQRMLGSISYRPAVPFAYTISGPYRAVPGSCVHIAAIDAASLAQHGRTAALHEASCQHDVRASAPRDHEIKLGKDERRSSHWVRQGKHRASHLTGSLGDRRPEADSGKWKVWLPAMRKGCGQRTSSEMPLQ